MSEQCKTLRNFGIIQFEPQHERSILIDDGFARRCPDRSNASTVTGDAERATMTTKNDDEKYTRRDDDERSRVESTYRGEILEKRREVELLLGRRGERRGVDGRGLAGRGDAAEGGAGEAIGVKVSVQRHGSFCGVV